MKKLVAGIAMSLMAAGSASAETMKVAADVGYSPHVMRLLRLDREHHARERYGPTVL